MKDDSRSPAIRARDAALDLIEMRWSPRNPVKGMAGWEQRELRDGGLRIRYRKNRGNPMDLLDVWTVGASGPVLSVGCNLSGVFSVKTYEPGSWEKALSDAPAVVPTRAIESDRSISMPQKKSLTPRVKVAQKGPAGKLTPLEKFFPVHHDMPFDERIDNELMRFAGSVWYELAVEFYSSHTISAINYRPRVDAWPWQSKIDDFMVSGKLDRAGKAKFYRRALGLDTATVLDAIIVLEMTISDAAKAILKRDNTAAQNEFRGRFRQALRVFSSIALIPSTSSAFS